MFLMKKQSIYIPFDSLFMHKALFRHVGNEAANFLTQDKKRPHFIKFYKFCKKK